MEIREVMAKLNITQAQADALDALDGKDGKISQSVFETAKAMREPNTPEGHKSIREQNPVLANQIDLALNPLPNALSKESERNLIFAGINKDSAEWINIKEANIENRNGEKYLVLKSSDNFDLEICLSDEKYDPSQIEFWRAEDECNVHISGITKGNLIINGADYDSGFEFDSAGFAIHNSNMHVKCADGIADRIAIYEGSKVDIDTNDWADTRENRTEDGYFVEEQRMKPGGYSVSY